MDVNEIIFLIEDDPEGGYSAKAFGHSIYTQGQSKEELKRNISDAMECHFDKPAEIPKVVRLHYVHEEMFAYA